MTPHDLELGIERLQPSGNAHAFAPRTTWPHDRVLADVPVPLCRIGAHGQILQANRPAAQLLGLSAEQLLGMPLHEFGANDGVRQHLEHVALLVSMGNSQQEVRHQCLRTANRIVHVDMHYSEIQSPAGIGPQWLVALIDQTHLQQEHEALRHTMQALRHAHDTNQELALVADRSPNMIMICDAERRIRWVNPSFTKITGYSLSEAIGNAPPACSKAPTPTRRCWT